MSFFTNQLSNYSKKLWQSNTQRVIALTGLGMGLALLVDIIIAARLGTTDQADSILVSLSLARLIETVFREGTKFSLVTYLVEKKNLLADEYIGHFLPSLFNFFVVLSLIIAIISWVFAHGLIKLAGPGISESAQNEAVLLFRILIPLFVFAILNSFLGAYLNSQSHFVIVAGRNMAMPLIVVIVSAFTWSSDNFSISIAYAHSIGYFLFFLLLAVYVIGHNIYKHNWLAWPKREHLKDLWFVVFYPSLGLVIRQGGRLLERAIASLVLPGGLSTYYFSFRLVSAIQTLVGVSIATTGLPKIAKTANSKSPELFFKTFNKSIRYTIFLSGFIALVVLVFPNFIISTLYGRNAFTEESVLQAARVLQYLSLSIVFLCLAPLFNAALYAHQKYLLVLLNQSITTVFGLAVAWFLAKQFGLPGISLAVGLTAILSILLQYLFLKSTIKPTVV